uniref:protein FAM104B-like n=1 Tax=Myodes glareolus TaxID=447135 RepID=UPI0020208742|nr:protein FAM104B-like [Myodes glareolus]
MSKGGSKLQEKRRDDNEEDNHDDPHSKRNKKDQAFQDPRAIELSNSDNERNHSSINNPVRGSVPESTLNQNIAEHYSNIPNSNMRLMHCAKAKVLTPTLTRS